MKGSNSKKTCNQAKMAQVMSEFKKGTLKTGSGVPVKNPKQAIAIGLSESRAKCGYPPKPKPKKK